MSRATQQTGRYRMRFCAACGEVFTYDNRYDHRERRTHCPKCREDDAQVRAENAQLRVVNRGRIPGGCIHRPRWI